MTQEKMDEVVIGVLGASNVGKTTTILTYTNENEMFGVIEKDEFVKIINVEGKKVTVRIRDTKNETWKKRVGACDAFVFLYDVTQDVSTLSALDDVIRQTREIRGELINSKLQEEHKLCSIPMVVVCNKMDLRNNLATQHKQTDAVIKLLQNHVPFKVPTNQLPTTLKKHPLLVYSSITTQTSIEEVFASVVGQHFYAKEMKELKLRAEQSFVNKQKKLSVFSSLTETDGTADFMALKQRKNKAAQ